MNARQLGVLAFTQGNGEEATHHMSPIRPMPPIRVRWKRRPTLHEWRIAARVGFPLSWRARGRRIGAAGMSLVSVTL